MAACDGELRKRCSRHAVLYPGFDFNDPSVTALRAGGRAACLARDVVHSTCRACAHNCGHISMHADELCFANVYCQYLPRGRECQVTEPRRRRKPTVLSSKRRVARHDPRKSMQTCACASYRNDLTDPVFGPFRDVSLVELACPFTRPRLDIPALAWPVPDP